MVSLMAKGLVKDEEMGLIIVDEDLKHLFSKPTTEPEKKQSTKNYVNEQNGGEYDPTRCSVMASKPEKKKIPEGYPKTSGCDLYDKLVTKVNHNGLCIKFKCEPTLMDFSAIIREEILKVGDCIFNSRENFPIKYKKNGDPRSNQKSVIDSPDYDRNLVAYVGVDQVRWKDETCESIYFITINGHIIKIGETTCSIEGRFGSYLCGDRAAMKKGSCSTTNFIINEVCYAALLLGHIVEIYALCVPKERIVFERFGKKINVTSSVIRGVEEMITVMFENNYGHIPILCSQKGSSNTH